MFEIEAEEMIVRWDHHFGDETPYSYIELARTLHQLHERVIHA